MDGRPLDSLTQLTQRKKYVVNLHCSIHVLSFTIEAGFTLLTLEVKPVAR
jgi:hypothetical protein